MSAPDRQPRLMLGSAAEYAITSPRDAAMREAAGIAPALLCVSVPFGTKSERIVEIPLGESELLDLITASAAALRVLRATP